MKKNAKKKEMASKALFVIYVLFLIYILYFDGSRTDSVLSLSERLEHSVNLKPFHTIDSYITAVKNGKMAPAIAIGNLFGNLILFLPMGYLLPKLSRALRKAYITVPLTAVLISAVEVFQLLTGRGRLDVDDFILNLTGALIGFIFRFIVPSKQHKKD